MSQNDNSDLGILVPTAIGILGCALVGWLTTAAKEMFHSLGEMFNAFGKFMVVFCAWVAVTAVTIAIIGVGLWLVHKIYVAIKERAKFEEKLSFKVSGISLVRLLYLFLISIFEFYRLHKISFFISLDLQHIEITILNFKNHVSSYCLGSVIGGMDTLHFSVGGFLHVRFSSPLRTTLRQIQ